MTSIILISSFPILYSTQDVSTNTSGKKVIILVIDILIIH